MAQKTKNEQLCSVARKGDLEELVWAALYGDLEEVKSLCSDPAVNVNWQDEEGFTALSCACQEGLSLLLEHLLAHPKIDPTWPTIKELLP